MMMLKLILPKEGSHSSILAWKIPWTDESGRLQSIRLQRVGHEWAKKKKKKKEGSSPDQSPSALSWEEEHTHLLYILG